MIAIPPPQSQPIPFSSLLNKSDQQASTWLQLPPKMQASGPGAGRGASRRQAPGPPPSWAERVDELTAAVQRSGQLAARLIAETSATQDTLSEALRLARALLPAGGGPGGIGIGSLLLPTPLHPVLRGRPLLDGGGEPASADEGEAAAALVALMGGSGGGSSSGGSTASLQRVSGFRPYSAAKMQPACPAVELSVHGRKRSRRVAWPAEEGPGGPELLPPPSGPAPLPTSPPAEEFPAAPAACWLERSASPAKLPPCPPQAKVQSVDGTPRAGLLRLGRHGAPQECPARPDLYVHALQQACLLCCTTQATAWRLCGGCVVCEACGVHIEQQAGKPEGAAHAAPRHQGQDH